MPRIPAWVGLALSALLLAFMAIVANPAGSGLTPIVLYYLGVVVVPVLGFVLWHTSPPGYMVKMLPVPPSEFSEPPFPLDAFLRPVSSDLVSAPPSSALRQPLQ